MHYDPGHPWTLRELAGYVCMSRTFSKYLALLTMWSRPNSAQDKYLDYFADLQSIHTEHSNSVVTISTQLVLCCFVDKALRVISR
jgi:hypothetical protein